MLSSPQLSAGDEVAVKSCVTRVKGSKPGSSASDLKYVEQEVNCLGRLQETMHENVANMLALHEGKYEVHIILQYGAGGSLHRHLQGLDFRTGMAEAQAAAVLHQVGEALAHIHSRGVTHRDVKASNVVFDGPDKQSVRIVDFGFAALHFPRGAPSATAVTPPAAAAPAPSAAVAGALAFAEAGMADPSVGAAGTGGGVGGGGSGAGGGGGHRDYGKRLHTVCGTPSCMAPELVKCGVVDQSRAGYFGPPVDVWALACMAFEMLCSRPAFTADSMKELHVRILRCSHHPFPDFVSSRAKAFVRSLLVADALDRPTAADAAVRLRGGAFAPVGRRRSSATGPPPAGAPVGAVVPADAPAVATS